MFTLREKDFECKTCKQTFKSCAKRDNHQILEHSTDEKYNCSYCGIRFGEIRLVKNHIRTYHEGPKLKCEYCGKLFKSKETLKFHERMHRGEKPYPCSLCAEAFTSSKGISQHMRGVHKISKKGGKVGWGHWGKGKRRQNLE